MINDKRVLAIIPARGGSKGIPKKNIKEINGKPLIAYSIEGAKESKYIDRVVVSTDSREIADVSMQYGTEVPRLRPAELASDAAKTIDAIMDMVQYLKSIGDEYDVLVLLQPTSPLRTASDMDQALELYMEKGCKSLLSVSEVADAPVLIRKVKCDGTMEKLLQKNSTVRRQDMEQYYKVNGSIYINGINELNEQTSFNDNEIPYIMPVERSVDIDEFIDIEIMKYYLREGI